jgi:hypothetical protein
MICRQPNIKLANIKWGACALHPGLLQPEHDTIDAMRYECPLASRRRGLEIIL